VGRGFCPSQERGFLQGKSFSLRAFPICNIAVFPLKPGGGETLLQRKTQRKEHIRLSIFIITCIVKHTMCLAVLTALHDTKEDQKHRFPDENKKARWLRPGRG
jgi:hypothetical protein